MTKPNFPVPTEIPGQLITDPQRLNELKNHLADLCHLDNIRFVFLSFRFSSFFLNVLMYCTFFFGRFPGSQPVSFDRESMRLLEREK